MRSSDLAQVLQIERNVQPVPWSRLSFEESLTRQDESHALDSNPGNVLHRSMVICSADSVLGFHITSLICDEFHILNLAVAPQFQGIGLGHYLMQDLIQLASMGPVRKLFLEVRQSNTKAISLYEKWQFKQIGLRKKYYRSNEADGNEREDALIFCRESAANEPN